METSPGKQKLFNDENGFGHRDLFNKCWEEVIQEGSAYFPGGQLKVGLKMMKLPAKF